MKKLYFILMFTAFVFWVVLSSCTKYRPDFDQVTCENCLSIKQTWKDSAQGLISIDTVFNGTLCANRLNSFKYAKKESWVKICGGGEPIYWICYLNKTY